MDQLYMVRAHAPRATVANKRLPRMSNLSEKDPGCLGLPFERFERRLLTIQDRRLRFVAGSRVQERNMDYKRALNELYQELHRLGEVIKNLESLRQGKQPQPLSRRGRKSMPAAERQIVSERMRNYWASRRHKQA